MPIHSIRVRITQPAAVTITRSITGNLRHAQMPSTRGWAGRNGTCLSGRGDRGLRFI